MIRKGKWRYYILLSVIIIISTPFLFKKDNSVKALTASDTLYFGDYHYFYWTTQKGPPQYVDWYFSGSNSYVGIEVWLLNDEGFADFQSLSSFSGYQLSDGGYYRADGVYDLPYEDYWYVVFGIMMRIFLQAVQLQ